MAVRRVEDALERLSALRAAPEAQALPALRKSLGDRVNVVVAKAARVAVERGLRELIPDLLAAFDRFFDHPADSDPQCWGKVAIAKALRDLEYREAAPFLRGVQHVQLEASWGKREDTAAPLRGDCLLALAACTDIPRGQLLRALVDALTEPAAAVRLESVRALAEVGGDDAALLLRMKARLGDEDPQIVGLAFDALWKLEGEAALPFLARFLESESEDVRVEAALALGGARAPAAADILLAACERSRPGRFREVLFRALSISRQPQALDYLKRLVKTARPADVKAALDALALHREDPEIRRILEQAESR